jgi:dolichol-phosphate mannosyltransferase
MISDIIKSNERLIKYAIVGASGVVINLGVLYTLTDYFGIHYMVSGLIAIELSIINNFIWNDKWTFGGGTFKHGLFLRLLGYHCTSSVSTLIQMLILAGLTFRFGMYYIYASCIGIFVAFVINYILNSKLTWEQKKE